MEPGLYEKMKDKITTHIKTYEDPQLDEHGHLLKQKKTTRVDED